MKFENMLIAKGKIIGVNYNYKERFMQWGWKIQFKGQKNGKWMELIDRFQNNTQVILVNIKMIKQLVDGIIMVGRLYDQRSDDNKIGRQIEMSDGFQDDSKLTYKGEYKNNQKVGKSESFWSWVGNKNVKLQIQTHAQVLEHLTMKKTQQKLEDGWSQEMGLVYIKMGKKQVNGKFLIQRKALNNFNRCTMILLQMLQKVVLQCMMKDVMGLILEDRLNCGKILMIIHKFIIMVNIK
ncbi:unnamed protein product [Paramecium pentaurelia]|uniref:Uncharacterized protein n=1 Tax=Paramecium pentaurelia TaxID=43138 RepID=A0A8S1YQ29_9CILI|nr:unnamed protein product [Paramecium pentaurelia]